jgi:hypothetical protein
MLSRRGLITGLISFVAAPAIVRASSLMPIRAIWPGEVRIFVERAYYIANPPIGCDSNDGLSAATPWATWRKTWEHVKPNEGHITVNIADGYYFKI